MKYKPYGIGTLNGRKPKPQMKPSDFSDDHYDGVRCGYDRKDRPVVIMRSRFDDPLRWKVQYGFSTVFFESFQEAIDFCNSRNLAIMKESEETFYG